MEIVVFISMMIVPFISIAALIVSVLTKKRADALKALVIRLMSGREKREAENFLTIEEI